MTATVVAGAAADGNVFWDGNTNSVWNNVAGTTNWLDGVSGSRTGLPISTSNVFFTATTASNLSTRLGQGFFINSLSFTGTGTPAETNVVTIGGTNTLTLLAANSFTD